VVYMYWWWCLNRLVWSISITLTLSRVYDACINNGTHGGAYCGVAIIIVVDVQMDVGDGGGGGT
jgi:hypothetical protein